MDTAALLYSSQLVSTGSLIDVKFKFNVIISLYMKTDTEQKHMSVYIITVYVSLFHAIYLYIYTLILILKKCFLKLQLLRYVYIIQKYYIYYVISINY